MSIFLTLVYLPFVSTQVTVQPTQLAALVQFLNETYARPITFNPMACPFTVTTTQRVSCNSQGRITQLFLNHANLTGPIPPSLLLLTDLVYLNVSDNFLTGDVQSLSALSKLVEIDLSYNALTGNAIALISSLPSLNLCVLQQTSPYDTNCFYGAIYPNASLCANPSQNPLNLCRTYMPIPPSTLSTSATTSRATTTTSTTTSTKTVPATTVSVTQRSSLAATTTTKSPTCTTSATSTAKTTAFVTSQSGVLDTSTVGTEATSTTTSTATSTAATTTTNSSKLEVTVSVGSSQAKSASNQAPSMTLIVIVLSVLLGGACLTILAYVVGKGIVERRKKLERMRGRYRRTLVGVNVSDRETSSDEADEQELRSYVGPPIVNNNNINNARSQYGPVPPLVSAASVASLPPPIAPLTPRSGAGYTNLPIHVQKALESSEKSRGSKSRGRSSRSRAAAKAKASLPPPFNPYKPSEYDKVNMPPAVMPSLDADGYGCVPAESEDEEASYSQVRLANASNYDRVGSDLTNYTQCEDPLKF